MSTIMEQRTELASGPYGRADGTATPQRPT
jgi:hypothetical protein